MLKPKVLFLCTGNSARSQMAEAFLRDMAGDRFEALSAGITPRGLHPLAVEVMREIGIDISQQVSKDVRGFLGTPIPYIVTVSDNAKEHCPIFPGTYKQHWSFEDPAAAEGTKDQKLTVFRRVRNEIASRVEREFATTRQAAG
jgi:arsenate reductase (thioredoxin)